MKLIIPTQDLADKIQQFKAEYNREVIPGANGLNSYDSIDEWVEHVTLLANKNSCPKELVPSSTFLAIEDNEIVGVIDIRHHLNHPILSKWGGNIGYSIKPSQRNKGYGKEMLKHGLAQARNLGLYEVLISCSADNIASKNIITANGGIYERSVDIDGTMVQRYWIALGE
ncbi:MAG: hypothetical protein BEN18_07180 [Epulopiscium sp. Nuni2H_MBin001]|nr:MAG: hypothetical protein BEN18_07180 [Epulopiscium sp. Nuni2H_MBin001]